MASGDTLLTFLPVMNERPASNPAIPDTGNTNPLLNFDGTVNKSGVWSAIMPQHYDGGGIDVIYHYQMLTATSGDVDLDGAFERNEDGADMSADGFAAVQSIDNTTVPGAIKTKDIITKSFTHGTQINNIVAVSLTASLVILNLNSSPAAILFICVP